MANSKAISVRIPDEYLVKIDKLAERKYKSIKGTPNRSLVVLDAIVAFFKTPSDSVKENNLYTVSDSVSITDFKELQDIVLALSKNVEELKKTFNTSSDTVFEVSDSTPEAERKSTTNRDHTQLSVLGVEEGLTVAQLAERFGIRKNDITSKKSTTKADPSKFINWSKAKDPEGKAWEFRENSKLYYPASLSEGEAEAQSSHPKGLAF
jgi:metal-responsive CopG/Arc/MetJ family transcriptional regulator